MRLQVVGAGLLGTSVGLALAETEWEVAVADADPAAERLAGELGAGRPGWLGTAPDLVLIAVPPSSIGVVMKEVNRLFPQVTVSDVGSIKTKPQQDAERFGLADQFVGGHPMAGRERSGASGAQSELFQSRPWALCPSAAVAKERVDLVVQLVRDCGADPVLMDAETHDAAVALVSHLPQVAASGVAGMLRGADPSAMGLAGQGLRDTVRIAGSDPRLWAEILAGNAPVLAPLVEQLAADLAAVGRALRESAQGTTGTQIDKEIERFVEQGQRGYRSIPGKHGAAPIEYAVVPVVIPDESGALARLFTTVAKAGASVEDIALEHSPGHPVGIIELSVRPDQAAHLRDVLDADGWSAH